MSIFKRWIALLWPSKFKGPPHATSDLFNAMEVWRSYHIQTIEEVNRLRHAGYTRHGLKASRYITNPDGTYTFWRLK